MQPCYGFDMKGSLIEGERKYSLEPQKDMPPVSLLLCRKIMAVCWSIGLQLWLVNKAD